MYCFSVVRVNKGDLVLSVNFWRKISVLDFYINVYF